MSPAEHLPQVYDDFLKLAVAGMRHEAAGQPRADVHFADELNSPQPASVGTAAAGKAVMPNISGPIDRGIRW